MRLFKLTFATILHRKSWALCLVSVAALPFAFPLLSSATEKPVLVQPARILAAWGTLWICTMIWGLFTAAREGESNAKSGIGEYFQTTGVSATRQLLEIWLSVMCFIVLFALVASAVCLFAAAPGNPVERGMWWTLNLQYFSLFLLVTGPLMALATALASRFGGIAGFTVTLLITVYGLYGVGYLQNMLQLEENAALHAIWTFSPHYNFADLTQRLLFKSGALPTAAFWSMVLYFAGILAVYSGVSSLCFRAKAAA